MTNTTNQPISVRGVSLKLRAKEAAKQSTPIVYLVRNLYGQDITESYFISFDKALNYFKELLKNNYYTGSVKDEQGIEFYNEDWVDTFHVLKFENENISQYVTTIHKKFNELCELCDVQLPDNRDPYEKKIALQQLLQIMGC